jgi:nucleotide-binding universal stress UspA family protein
MANSFVVGYAGPDLSRRAVEFAVDRARAAGAAVHLVHVIEWSPYTFQTADVLAERHGARDAQQSQAEAMLETARSELAQAGINATAEVRFGHVADVLCDVADAQKACQIFVGRSGGSPLANRIIGSASLTLVQASPVPVTVVP